jgi:hypothetical protein
MKKLYFFLISLLALGYSYATIINVPADQPTIQAGIDAAVNGDTVLGQPGTYYENINFNGKGITVASLYLITPDTSYISQTIIDGGGEWSGNGVVSFGNGEDSTAILCGFTITRGITWKGGGINCWNSSPKLKNLIIRGNSAWFGGGIALDNSSCVIHDAIICSNSALNDGLDGSTNPEADGGGIFCVNSYPVILNSTISNNWVSSLRGGPIRGGGVCFWGCGGIMKNVQIKNNFVEPGLDGPYMCLGGGICGGDSLYLSNVIITGNSATKGGGIALANIIFDTINRCSIYLNHANQGNDLFTYSSETLDIVLDTFTVASPKEFFASPIEKFNFDILNGYTEIIETEDDLYVSPEGDNSNSGLTEDDPLKNIGQALAMIQADSTHPHTINLLEGTYSQSSNGEIFPLYLTDYISLSGFTPGGITLDAEGNSILAAAISRKGIKISDLTIKEGRGGRCGGLLSDNTVMELENVRLINNRMVLGGAIKLNQSSPAITNCLIAENQGFGILCNESDPYLTNVTISNNDSSSATNEGGGMYCINSSSPIVVNSILWNDVNPEIVLGWWNDTNSVTIQHSDLQGGEEGIEIFYGTVNWLEGNIEEDPLFMDTGDYPYALTDGSPCIDTGTPDTTGLNLPPWDILGNCRIWDGNLNGIAIVDMGAYEFGSIPVGVKEPQISVKSLEFEVRCYPNPTYNKITISIPALNSITRFSIYNVNGAKLIERQLTDTEIQLDISALPRGVYFVRLQNEAFIETVKMIKQ